jgi:hypothetical protein
MTETPVTVLLTDDDKVDSMAVRRAFRQLKLPNRLIEAHSGIEALQWLRGEAGHERIVPPYVVLLDLNMPRMNGIEFLDEVRRDPALRTAPVVVMTTSASPEDRTRAYERNVAGYVVKGRGAGSFADTIRALAAYWQAIEYAA